MKILCKLGFHDWTSDSAEEKNPTKEQLENGLDGFWEYASLYCKNCGDPHPKYSHLTKSYKTRKEKIRRRYMGYDREHEAGMLKNELMKMNWYFNNVSSIDYFRVACQGNHPITGQTCVVNMRSNCKSIHEAKMILKDLFYGIDNYLIQDFAERVKKKLPDSYAHYVSIHGKDFDGDRVDFDFRFQSQKQIMDVCENGLFRLEDKSGEQVLMLSE